MRRRGFLFGAMLAAFPQWARAQDVEALAGDRFRLGDQDYQLADILAPSAYALGEGAAPYYAAAKAVLTQLISPPPTIETVLGETRWGAKIIRARASGDALSLAERLVDAGAARVAPDTDDLDHIDRLLKRESEARARRRGLWALDAYRVADAGKADAAIGAYNLVEGVVLRASAARSRFYLNFGADYRKDFTAVARSGVYRRWAADGFDLASLEGARLRVRGFVDLLNGPMIELTHRRQVERL